MTAMKVKGKTMKQITRHCYEYISMFIEDLIAIAANAFAFEDRENGGALFGLRSNGGRPVVFIATPAGPGAIREYAYFAQDPDYLYNLAVWLQEQFGFQCLGNDHRHLGSSHPSGGDEEQASRMMKKLNLQNMIQIIVTRAESGRNPSVRIDAYLYRSEDRTYQPVRIKILQGRNPFHHMLAYAECLKQDVETPSLSLNDISFDEYCDGDGLSEGKAVLIKHISNELNKLPLSIAQTAEVDVNNNEASLILTESDDASIVILYSLLPDNHCRISEYTRIVSGEQKIQKTIPADGAAPRLIDLMGLKTAEKPSRLSNTIIL